MEAASNRSGAGSRIRRSGCSGVSVMRCAFGPSPEDVDAALAFYERVAERGEAPAGELLRENLGLAAGAQADLPVTDIEARGWLKELLGTNGDRKLREGSTPVAFEGELRPY